MRVTWEARNGFSMIHVPPIFVPEVRTHSMATQGGIRTHISISSRIAVQVVDCKQEGWLAVKGKTHCLCLHYRAFACCFAAARCKHGSWTKQLECASKSRHLPWEQLRSAVASASLKTCLISLAWLCQGQEEFYSFTAGGVQWISRHMLHTASADSGAPRHRCSQHLAAASAPTKIWKKIQKIELPAHWTHGTPAHRKWIKMTKQGPSRTHVFDCSTPPLQGESLLEPSVPDLVVQSRISKGQPVAMECYSITASRARKWEIHGNRFQKSIKRLKTRPNGPIRPQRPNVLFNRSISVSLVSSRSGIATFLATEIASRSCPSPLLSIAFSKTST